MKKSILVSRAFKQPPNVVRPVQRSTLHSDRVSEKIKDDHLTNITAQTNEKRKSVAIEDNAKQEAEKLQDELIRLENLGYERNTSTPSATHNFVQDEGEEYYVKRIKLPLVVHLIYLISPYWEWVMMFQICATYYIVTYSMFFAVYIPILYQVMWLLDLIFLIDTFIRISIEIWRYKSSIPCLIFLVPYTFSQYLLDVISAFPSGRLYLNTVKPDTFEALKYFDFCRVNRFLRFSRAFKFFTIAVNERRVSEVPMFILKYLTQYLVILQFVACLFFYILPSDPIDFMLYRRTKERAFSWIKNLDREKPNYGKEHFDHYAISISLAACVLTTTGYGDFSGTTSLEMGIMSLIMLIGAIIISGFFSSGLATFKLENDGALFDLYFRVGAIVGHLTHIQAHEIYINKVIEYYSLLWNYREGVYDVTFMSELPQSVVEDMFYDICREMFHKAPLFRGLDENFLRCVSKIVHVVIYNPNMIICSTGDYAMNMFYLLQGEVHVKSKLDRRMNGGILRAGCIIGEMNLFFSYPYTTTLETRTCCQLLQIEKFELFELLKKHEQILKLLRKRVDRRFVKVQNDYEIVGKEPICWVQQRVNPSLSNKSDIELDFPVVMRSGKGFNRIIYQDVLDDTEDVIIIDMPCIDKSYEKKHTQVFKTCVIPPILNTTETWVKWWNTLVLLISVYSAIMAPYCHHFVSNNELMKFLCDIDSFIEFLFCFVYMCDIVVEICYSCPVTGLYYKFKDGLSIRLSEVTFWIDVISAIPFAAFDWANIQEIKRIVNIVRCLRLWKVGRYFEYLDNIHPDSLFLFRLIRAIFSIVYGTHLASCYLYSFACSIKPGRTTVNCERVSWLRSFTEGKTGFSADARHDVLGITEGYWISFYFACATVTTTGFGDFSPQTRTEMIFLAASQLLSFCITGYYTALLTSALSCIVRPKLVFQQKLIGVRQFLTHKGLAEPLQKRIIEHYYLQDQLWSGVSLPDKVSHYMYDTPEYLHEDAIYQEVELHFDGVPIFTKLDPKILVNITKLMRRYLIPPGAIFVRKGEVRRQMYVIGRGSVAFFSDKDDIIPTKILDETGHFGLRDLLFGEPSHHDIKTMSYCLLYEVELRDLFEAMRSDIDLLAHVEVEKQKLQHGIDAMILEYSLNSKNLPNDDAKEIPSFIYFPKYPRDIMKHCTYQEYEEVFDTMKRPKIFRCFLMRMAIHPAGTFARFWISFMSLVAAMIVGSFVAETFGGRRTLDFRIISVIMDVFTWIDIYLKLHWAYYTDSNMLISHPVQTSIRYMFKGEFLLDVLISIPFELMIPLVTGTSFFGYSQCASWYSKFRWTRFSQIIRIPAVIKIFHSVFKFRNILLLVSYASISLFICTIVASIAESVACPPGTAIWSEGDENKLPFCREGTYIRQKPNLKLDTSNQRWVLGIYYVSQVMFSVGCGDMTTLSVVEMRLLIAVSLFGFGIVRCILADITAAEVDIDEVRQKYLESIIRINFTMTKEQVPTKVRKSVLRHMYHTWDMSKGLQPRQLFRDLHPALEADLFRDLVGDDLKRVPIFQGFRENILRTICQYMNTVFFRKGERITRYGNMEREMYIIVQGQVWIADRYLLWTHTLSDGESFGEVSIVYKQRRIYNAIASTDVELFVLSVEDFETVLQRYPAVLDELKLKLTDDTLDIFQKTQQQISVNEMETISSHIKTWLARNGTPDPDERKIFKNIREGFFYQLVSNLFGSGQDDQDLPFIYIAHDNTNKIGILIHPKCTFMRLFMWLVILICYLSPALSVYQICFYEEIPSKVGKNIADLSWAIELPMYLHIILQFITPFKLANGSYCKVFHKIVFNYLTSFNGFWINLIATLPFYLLNDNSAAERSTIRYLETVRLLRLIYFYRSHMSKVSDLATSTIRYKITLSMSVFFLMVHFIACVFYNIAACSCSYTTKITGCTDEDVNNMCPMGTWTHEFVRTNEVYFIRRLETWRWYIRSTYWVICTVSTTGFGDITPVNTHETLLAIFTIFCGAFIISIILSHFASGISSLNRAYREYIYQVNLLLKHMGNIGMSQERIDKVLSYFSFRWEKCRGVRYHDSTSVLPSTMSTTICYALYHDVVYKNSLLSNKGNTMFHRQLCGMFKHYIYTPGINIVTEDYLEMEESVEGAACTTGTMFLLFRGRISAYGKNKDGEQILLETFGVGQLFAKYSAFFYDLPYDKTYRAETKAEILGITQSQMIELVTQYPEFAETIQNTITMEYSHFVEQKYKTIFEPRITSEDEMSTETTEELEEPMSVEPNERKEWKEMKKKNRIRTSDS